MDAASSSEPSGGPSDSTVELNIKTLDSHIYSFRVDKDTPVSSFKEKIAEEIGLPVAQQRLIFRGKVLKDEHPLSEYHVEDGHTLHLVERQPAQSQPPSGESNANTNPQGNNNNVGAPPRNRIGQISHSVVLGTFNVGDQGEGAVPDVSRVIGAVLNSLGIANQTTPNMVQNPATAPASGQAPHGNGADSAAGNAGNQAQQGNPAQPGQPFPNLPFQFPMAGATVPIPSIHSPIPDSLNTLCEFMSRMEGVLSQIGGNPGNQSSPSMPDQASAELPSNAGALPRPEALSIVLRRAQQLLEGGATASLSHIAGRLEQESTSTDASVRSQIQSELVQAGLAMQHLGALFLELGRTILTLRMGQSPAESVINAGPAVYISPQGPNPIMVQPFPMQTSPLFNSGANTNPGSLGPIGIIGSAPRHVNIHIHAGTALAPMVPGLGARPGAAEGAQGEQSAALGPGELGSGRVFRNVIATAVPRAAVGISSGPTMGPPVTGVSASQPPDSSPMASVVADINSQIRNYVSNLSAGSQQSSGQQEGVVQFSSVGLGTGGDPGVPREAAEANAPGSEVQKDQSETQQDANDPSQSMQASASTSSTEVTVKLESAPGGSTETPNLPDSSRSVPLGLGLGGLQPKRRAQPSKTQSKSSEGTTSGSTSSQGPNAIAAGQQVLQSLASFRPSSANEGPETPARSTVEVGASGGQPDMMGLMSQVLDSPAFSGILSGIAGQTGVGSADNLRNMFQQITQDPGSRNTINQFAQQVSREDLPSMFAGSGRPQGGGGGGMDLSGMLQQMMPIVSRALAGGSAPADPFSTAFLEPQPEPSSFQRISEADVQEVEGRVTQGSPAEEIFGALVRSALNSGGGGSEALASELCADRDLVAEFMEVFRRDLQRRHQDNAK